MIFSSRDNYSVVFLWNHSNSKSMFTALYVEQSIQERAKLWRDLFKKFLGDELKISFKIFFQFRIFLRWKNLSNFMFTIFPTLIASFETQQAFKLILITFGVTGPIGSFQLPKNLRSFSKLFPWFWQPPIQSSCPKYLWLIEQIKKSKGDNKYRIVNIIKV